MASLVKCKLQKLSGFESNTGREVTAEYFVEMTAASDDREVRIAATDSGVVSALSGDNQRVQRIGETFDLSSTAGIADEAVQVTRIGATQRDVKDFTKWTVTVQYRNPQFNDNQSGTAQDQPDRQVSPEKRKPRFWTERKTITVPRAFGKNLQEVRWPWNAPGDDGKPDPENEPEKREAGTVGPITNAAGFRYGQIETLQYQQPVFVYATYTLNPFRWIRIQDQFFGTTNNSRWQVFGKVTREIEVDDGIGKETVTGVAANTCAFEEAYETGPFFWGNTEYYELIVKVAYDPRGRHRVRVRNEGDKYWRVKEVTSAAGIGAVNNWVVDIPFAGGMAMQPPVPLSADGQLNNDLASRADVIEYEDLVPANYGTLDSLLNIGGIGNG